MRQHPGMPIRWIFALATRDTRRPCVVKWATILAWSRPPAARYKLAQGKPDVHPLHFGALAIAITCLGLLASMPAAAACGGPVLPMESIAPDLWLVPAAAGDSNADNRGQVSNLVVAFDGAKTWILGSGPSPTFGQRIDCTLQQRFRRHVTDIVSPWPRPELVLGAATLPRAQSWAHTQVADVMRTSCPGCVERLRLRLGDSATDLGSDPVRVPERRVAGTHGVLGPWRWRLLTRGAGHPVTVWEHRASAVRFAPGLLWGGEAPDGRDADLMALAASTHALADWGSGGVAARWIGEQGSAMDTTAVRRHARYWDWVLEAARRGVARGDDETRLPVPPPDLQALADSPRHALNWQRAWRQSELLWLQRSLR